MSLCSASEYQTLILALLVNDDAELATHNKNTNSINQCAQNQNTYRVDICLPKHLTPTYKYNDSPVIEKNCFTRVHQISKSK